MSRPDQPRKIAILGGGCGSLSAALELTRNSDWKERYDITVYQMGWRLGGKGASGRNLRPCKGKRIEEHGLHVWGGFYHNAFRLMADCYRELGRPASAPLSQLFEPSDGRRADNGMPVGAFKPQRHVVLMECLERKNPDRYEWVPWCIEFPAAPYSWLTGLSGLAMYPGRDDAELPGIFDYVPNITTYLYQYAGGYLDPKTVLPRDISEIALPDWIDGRLRSRLEEWKAPTEYLKPVGSTLDLEAGIERMIAYADDDKKAIKEYDLIGILPLIPPYITPDFVRIVLDAFRRDGPVPARVIAKDWGERMTLALALAQNVAESELLEEVDSRPEPPDYPPPPRALSLITEKLHECAQLFAVNYLLSHGDTDEHTARRINLLLDVGAAVLEGMSKDFLWMLGFESIDNIEFRTWLKRHGAQDETLNSAVVMPAYDYAFGYPNGNVGEINLPASSPRGDANSVSLAAGTALKGTLELISRYRGAIFWEMEAGMGDVVFAPIYKVLKDRGVKFKFFHRIEKLHLSEDGDAISHISGLEQMTVKTGGEYKPLIDVDGLPCWPSEPKYKLLNKGDDLKQNYRGGLVVPGLCPSNDYDMNYNLESVWNKWDRLDRSTPNEAIPFSLVKGVDFDDVVLGISIGAFRGICKELMAESPDWKNMVDKIGVVPTVAMQLWLSKTTTELGWPPKDNATGQPQTGTATCSDTAPPILTGFAHRLNTWADLSYLAWTGNKAGHKPVEKWKPLGIGETPKSLAYFCGPMKWPMNASDIAEHDKFLDETNIPNDALNEAKDQAIKWIKGHCKDLWPNHADEKELYDMLVAPATKVGEERLMEQYFRANVNPSDLYVMSKHGSTKYRLPAGDSGFENLYLAGDWVHTSLNAGCVECAVMAGQEAARAISGEIPGGLLHWLAYLAGEVTGATAVVSEDIGEGVADSAQSIGSGDRR